MSTSATHRSKPHRFPAAIISQGVWRYFRCCLNSGDGEALLGARSVLVSDEAIRQWGRKFGQQYATQLRRQRPRPGDTGHLDEGCLTLQGQRSYLWRAVEQDGNVLAIRVQHRREDVLLQAAQRLEGAPRVIITDRLASYGAAKRESRPGVEPRQHRYLNNRADNPHQPMRQRERRMQRVKSPGPTQRFLATSEPSAQYFRPRRHRCPAAAYRQERPQRLDTWQAITSLPSAA